VSDTILKDEKGSYYYGACPNAEPDNPDPKASWCGCTGACKVYIDEEKGE